METEETRGAGAESAERSGRLRVHVLPHLPPLAWLVDLSGPASPMLLCGTDVETSGSAFAEGCWAGAFDAWDFDRAQYVFGSGGKITDDGSLFVTPSHTLDALYTLQRGSRFMVSNSLPFLVHAARLELPFDFAIGARFASIMNGIDAYERIVFRGPDWSIYRAVYENFSIRGQDIKWTAKPSAPECPFADYTSYRDFLLEMLGRVVRNGSSPSRKQRYSVISACSSGYDSTACTALAALLGCRQAVTLRTAGGLNVPDSGRRVVEALGMEPIELERMTRAVGDDFKEAEFFASGLGGGEYPFRAFAPYCERKILFTGFNGDRMWDRHIKPSNNLARLDLSGSTLGEFRLRTCFVNVPVPVIGATWHDALVRISNSEEMRPYQVGGHYDRPLPRRIAEEAGVPRGCFAQRKKNGSITFGHLFGLWSKASLEDLGRFEQAALARQKISTPYYARWTAQTGAQLALIATGKPTGRIGLDHARDQVFNWIRSFYDLNYRHVRYNNMACLWAIDKLRPRYST